VNAPFPFFGGKREVTETIWARLGSPKRLESAQLIARALGGRYLGTRFGGKRLSRVRNGHGCACFFGVVPSSAKNTKLSLGLFASWSSNARSNKGGYHVCWSRSPAKWSMSALDVFCGLASALLCSAHFCSRCRAEYMPDYSFSARRCVDKVGTICLMKRDPLSFGVCPRATPRLNYGNSRTQASRRKLIEPVGFMGRFGACVIDMIANALRDIECPPNITNLLSSGIAQFVDIPGAIHWTASYHGIAA